MLPRSLLPPLQQQIASAKLAHDRELLDGYGEVELPDALARKYPNAQREWGWQYVFPAAYRSRDPRSGAVRRHHLSEDPIYLAILIVIARITISMLTPQANPSAPSPKYPKIGAKIAKMSDAIYIVLKALEL